MVRLEAQNPILSYFSSLSFNSYMVRLEDVQDGFGSSEFKRFNSYMVRLEVCRPTCCLREISLVSIPIWCDWKGSKILVNYMDDKFQFLYGAIGR